MSFDFTQLSATDAELPKQTRATVLDRTPLVGWVAETAETGRAKSVQVPNDQVPAVKSLVRSAANRLGLGARIREQDNGDGSTTVVFAGGEKQNRGPRSEESKAKAKATRERNKAAKAAASKSKK